MLVRDLICPITQSPFEDTPVMPPCGHTFSYGGLIGIIDANVQKSSDLWAFWTPGEYECATCREKFTLDQVTINNEWQRIQGIVKQWQEENPEMEIDDLELSAIGAEFMTNPSEGDSVFQEAEDWTFCEKTKFLLASVISCSLAALAEITLSALYLWGWGFITLGQYNRFRDIHVIQRLTPLYLNYMGINTERPDI